MKVYLSTWISDRSLGKSLTRKGAKHRLLSYYFLFEAKISKELIFKYVRKGKCDPRKSKEK